MRRNDLAAVIERYVESLEANDAGLIPFLETHVDRDDARAAYEAEFIDATGIDELPEDIARIVLGAMLLHGTHAGLVLLDAALKVRRIDGEIDRETIAAAEVIQINVFAERYADCLKRHAARVTSIEEPKSAPRGRKRK